MKHPIFGYLLPILDYLRVKINEACNLMVSLYLSILLSSAGTVYPPVYICSFISLAEITGTAGTKLVSYLD